MDDNTSAVEVLVPILSMLILFGAPVAAFIVFRILAHRERMEMIRHGMIPTGRNAKDWQYRGVVAGPPTGGPGISVPPNFDAQNAAQASLRKGISVGFVGLALTIGLSFIGFHGGRDFVLGPWLLGGLVPLFVGLAQIVIALISGATLGNLAPPPRNLAPPPWTPPGGAGSGYADPFTPGASTPGRATYDDSYTYRPGDTQELRRPVPPPERKP